MDEKTYRRLFTETSRQVFMRHNNFRTMHGLRKCRTCNPYGAVHAPTKCTSPKPCNDGWRSYVVARV